jgi:hypothetical protein
MKNLRCQIVFFFTLLTVFSLCFGQRKGDYLILTSPFDYTIFNEFKASLSTAEKGLFLPNSPLLTIDPDYAIDQITKAVEVEFRQSSYFLLKGEMGLLVGEKNSAARRVYKGCITLEDTIEILGRGITVQPVSGAAIAMEKGSRLSRVFRSGDRYYVLSLGDRPAYGWCALGGHDGWRKVAATTVAAAAVIDSALPQRVVERVQEKMAAANSAYKALFGHFDTLTKDNKSVPFWQGGRSGAGFRYELEGAASNGGQLAESTQKLAQELDNVLLGTSFMARFTEKEIVIERRPGVR